MPNEVASWQQSAGIYTSSALPLALPSDIFKHNELEKHCFKPKSTEIQSQQITCTKLIITLVGSEKSAVVVLSKKQPWNCSPVQIFMGSDKLTPVLNHI